MKSDLADLQALFSALADPTRLRIIGLLAKGEVCVCDLHDTLRVSQPKASRHLAYLRRAKLVLAEKRGLWVHYRLAPGSTPAVQAILERVQETLAAMEIVRRDRARLAKCCRSPASGACDC
jgi:ArsR family transcriptional regulator